MKYLLILSAGCIILSASCGSHKNGQHTSSVKDTSYVVYGKDSAATEVNITDGDTTLEEMELNHVLIPIKR